MIPSTVSSPLADFFQKSFDGGQYPLATYRAGQSSLCMFGAIDGNGMVRWRPVKRSGRHTDALAAYGSAPYFEVARELDAGYWCSTLDCWWGYKSVVLDCGAWNETAYQFKQNELRLHFQRKQGMDLPLSVPFAHSPSGSGCLYAFRIDSGEVWSEEEDGTSASQVSGSLAEFFDALRYDPIDTNVLNGAFD